MLIGNSKAQKLDLALNEATIMKLIDIVGKGLKEKVKEKKENESASKG